MNAVKKPTYISVPRIYIYNITNQLGLSVRDVIFTQQTVLSVSIYFLFMFSSINLLLCADICNPTFSFFILVIYFFSDFDKAVINMLTMITIAKWLLKGYIRLID